MEKPQLPQDDLEDVMDMTDKIEDFATFIVKEAPINIAMSALISATTNCILAKCESIGQAIFFRNLLLEVMDKTIGEMKPKDGINPPLPPYMG